MKKRSILLTCIVAVMALAMFVGCDSTPVFPDMPKSVKGGYLTQTGVILTGQEVTPDKFTLTVEYDNGDEPTVRPATNIQLDGTGNVFAVAGLDSDNNPVDTEKLLVAFTDANRIEATGFKESYTVAEAKAIKPSDLQVKAFYEGGEMNLTSSEFVVKLVDENALDTLVSPSNPTAQVEVVVRALVGVEKANQAASNVLDEKYLITINYAEPVETEYAIEKLTAVEFSTDYVLKALSYDEVPAPTLDDVLFNGVYDNGEYFWDKKLPSDTEIALSFVDARGLDLIEKNLIDNTDDEYSVKAIYNDEVIPFVGAKVKPAEVKVLVETVEGYTAPVFKAGDDVVAPIAEDYDVILNVGSSYERLDAAAKENVVFSYGIVNEEKFSAVDEFVEAHMLSVQATYMGESGYTVAPVTTVQKADPVPEISSITANFKSNIKAPAAMEAYDDIDAALAINPADILDSITLHMTEGADDVVVPASQFGNNVIALWTTEAYKYVPVEGDSIADGETFYILVRYTEDDGTPHDAYSGDTAITASKAVATGLNVEVKYTDTLNDDGVTPMMGTTATLTVEAVNDLGVVKILSLASDTLADGEDGYRIDNGKTEDFETTVGEEEATYTISAFVNGTRLEDQVTVLAGRDYVKFADEAETPTVSLAEDYVALIDSPISAITADNLVISNLAEDSTDDYTITIKAIQSSTKTVEATGNTILATVEWLASDGSYDGETVSVTFQGTAYTEGIESVVLNFEGAEEVSEKRIETNKPYAITGFTTNPKSVTVHGSDPNLGVVGFVRADNGLKEDGTPVDDIQKTGTIQATWPSEKYTIVISYTNTNGEVAYVNYNLTVFDPTQQ